MHLKVFDPHAASDAEWAALNEFENRMLAETFPDDPPRPLALTIREQTRTPAILLRTRWAAWREDGGAILGQGVVDMWQVQDNQHLAFVQIEVRPEARCQGIGTALLARAAATVQASGRSTLMGRALANVPSGAAFAERVGAKAGLPSRRNQFDMRDLDLARMRAWVARAQERAAGFSVGFWGETYTEEALEAVVHMLSAMNDAPHDDTVEEEIWTVDELRDLEATYKEQGLVRWTMYARETSSGAYAGYTEVYWNALQPTLLQQGDTAVLPAYRNLGLGRWLKAAMILRVLADRPQVRFVRTGNADANAPMLNINHEMGFRPFHLRTSYTIEAAQALAYTENAAAHKQEGAPEELRQSHRGHRE
ncbi:MAG: GNAT family N-acetyltransferase [Anaerolineae bacterium]